MKKTIIGLSAIALMLTACETNNFKVNGVAEGFNDGDTLIFYQEMGGEATDTLFIKNGKFSIEGAVDSVRLCSVTTANGMAGAVFFNEPGSINITIYPDKPSVVGGTKSNEGWQELNDIQSEFSQNTDKLLEQIYSQELDEEQQKVLVGQYEAAHKEMTTKILDTAGKYLDCELGFFLVASLAQNPDIDTDRIKELIEKMPDTYKHREAIEEAKNKLEAKAKTAIGQKIDNFTMNTPNGDEISVMDEVAQNKVTILDFWASWCGPCREEMPFMVSLYEKYHDKGLGIVGISLDQNQDDWVKAIKELGIGWPQMSDLKYWQSAAAEMFQVQSIPYMVIVDQQGIILNRGLRGEELETFVSEQLK